MSAPVLSAIEERDGTPWDDPSEEQLHDLLADMNLDWQFVMVERLDLEPAGQYYMYFSRRSCDVVRCMSRPGMTLDVTAEQIGDRDAELSALAASLSL